MAQFPGMNPYLEASDVWPDLHQSLAVELRAQLSPRLLPRYVALVHHDIAVEQVREDGDVSRGCRRADLTVVEGEPGPAVGSSPAATPATAVLPLPVRREVRQFRLELLRASDRRLVCVLELVSPANKRPGKDRDGYRAKVEAYLESAVHFIEVDLLRGGERWEVAAGEPAGAYRVLLRRSSHQRVEVWAFGLREPLPVIPVPLLRPDPDVTLDLGAALRRCVASAGYEVLLDYAGAPPGPPLGGEEKAFVRECVE